MADDISKKITVEVEMEAGKLTENINSLNKSIDSLLAKQQQLNTSGKQNAEAFDSISAKLDELQKKLQDATEQVTANTTALNALSTASKTAAGTVSSLTEAHQKNSKATSDSSAKTKDLNTQLNALGTANKTAGGSLSALTGAHQKNARAAGDGSTKTKELSGLMNALGQAVKAQSGNAGQGKTALDSLAESISKGASDADNLETKITDASTALKGQVTDVTENKIAFDVHKTTMDHLKKSFDEIKNVSGIFGPSLKDAADGFEAMKKGLTIVKGGLTGIGEAIKADGFGFLLQILQYLFDAFIKSSTGSAMLQGAISAIGVVVNEVESFFDSLKEGIVEAFSHPVESLRNLASMIQENVINRFKAIGVILHGLIHLDFKEMANGAFQAVSGVTNATEKIAKGTKALAKGAEQTVVAMGKAYKEGYDKAGKDVDKHQEHVELSVDQQIKKINILKKALTESYAVKTQNCKNSSTNTKAPAKSPDNSSGNITDDEPLTATSVGLTSTTNKDPASDAPQIITTKLKDVQNVADKTLAIKKTSLQQYEAFAKTSGTKLATDALTFLSNSIKQQSDAKVAALEKDKAAELTNSSLTSAQKLAIQQKYKQQEGQIKAKAFKEEQEASIAQAVINGALAVTKISAQTGMLAALEIGVSVAETAMQVAKIASQKPPAYAKGGLHYASDGKGGVLPGYSRTDNTNAYLRSGEGIVVSEAMQVPWARNLVSAVNVGFGGRDFSITNPGRGYAVGGIFTDGGDANRYYNQPVTDQKNLANTLAYQMINNFPPVYVDVKDVNNQQNILAQTINRVNL